MTTRLSRIGHLEPCRRCGLSTLAIREALRKTLEIIRRELPGEPGETVVEELRTLWTRQ